MEGLIIDTGWSCKFCTTQIICVFTTPDPDERSQNVKKAHATVTLSPPSTLACLDTILCFFANTKHALTAHNRIFLYPVTGKLFKGYSFF